MMRTRILSLLAVFLSIMSSFSFAGDTLIFSNPAEVIEVEAGEQFVISLDSNRTTGYEWQLSMPADDNVLQLVSSEYIPSSSELMGAGGEEEWHFLVLNSGRTTITFEYLRPWEKNIAPIQEETFVVLVK